MHDAAQFRWADVARILGVLQRTLRRRRAQLGFPIGREVELSSISDEDLDNHVREILTTTPSSGFRLVEGGLRSRGMHLQHRRIQDSIRRVDPVLHTLRATHSVIRRVYNVKSPNVLWCVQYCQFKLYM